MKLLAAVFAGIALLAALLGFGIHGIPIFSMLGKITAVIALAGLASTTAAYAMDDLIPSVDFDADDIHP
jgi:hypothetical protein